MARQTVAPRRQGCAKGAPGRWHAGAR